LDCTSTCNEAEIEEGENRAGLSISPEVQLRSIDKQYTTHLRADTD